MLREIRADLKEENDGVGENVHILSLIRKKF